MRLFAEEELLVDREQLFNIGATYVLIMANMSIYMRSFRSHRR